MKKTKLEKQFSDLAANHEEARDKIGKLEKLLSDAQSKITPEGFVVELTFRQLKNPGFSVIATAKWNAPKTQGELESALERLEFHMDDIFSQWRDDVMAKLNEEFAK